MFPLRVVIAGAKVDELPILRQAVANQPAILEKEFADADGAIAGRNTLKDAKYLFILKVDSARKLADVKRLNRSFPGHPILVLMNPDSDATAVLNTLRAGACQIVFSPFRFDDFASALQTIVQQFQCLAVEPKVTAISGVSEGCGATSLAINLGFEIANTFRTNTILAELSCRIGRLVPYLELTPKFTILDLLGENSKMDASAVEHALVQVSEHFRVLTGPYGTIGSLAPSGGAVMRLLALLRELSQVLILDMPYTFDQTYFETLSQADHIVLVAEQNVPSLHAMRMVHETLAQKDCHGQATFVINRFNQSDPVFKMDHIEELLGHDHFLTVANDPSAFRIAINEGSFLRRESPRSRALADIDRLAENLLGHKPPPQVPLRRSIFGWLNHLNPLAGKKRGAARPSRDDVASA